MPFKKLKLNILERLIFLKSGITWLAITTLPCYDHEAKVWFETRTSFLERFDCFLGGLDTFIRGYVWLVQ